MSLPLTRSQLRRWQLAVFAIFLSGGLSIATWASRVPAIKIALDIDNTRVGLMLLGAGLASIIGLSLSSVVLARFGARRGMLGGLLLIACGVLLVGVAADLVHSYPLVIIGLAVFGIGMGAVDVMMNVEGAAIEVQARRTLLPLFHAFFSVGTVIGAALGWAAVAASVSVFWHALAIGVLIVAIAFVAIANVPARDAALDPEGGERPPWRERLAASLSVWREPRTYALGVIILGMAFAEGGATDWLALSVAEGHGAGEATGAAALAVFSVSMTVARVVGGPLVDRFGRVPTLRVLAVTAVAGMLLFILAPNVPLVFVGVVLWGVGASLGFPLGMSAAADDPAKAAARVSAAAMIGYIAFLCGPPVLGFISEQIGLLNTLFILAALVAASGFASGAARPLPGGSVGVGRDTDADDDVRERG